MALFGAIKLGTLAVPLFTLFGAAAFEFFWRIPKFELTAREGLSCR